MCDYIKGTFMFLWNFIRTIPYVSMLAGALAFSGFTMIVAFWSPFMDGIKAFGFDFTEFEVFAMFFVNFYFLMCMFNLVVSIFTTGWIADKCCNKEEGCWANFVQVCVGEYLQLAFIVLSMAGTAICFVMVLVGSIVWTMALINGKMCSAPGGAGLRQPLAPVVELWGGIFGSVEWPVEFLNSKATGASYPCRCVTTFLYFVTFVII